MLQLVQRIVSSLGHRAVGEHDLVSDDLKQFAGVLKEVGQNACLSAPIM